MDDELEDKIVYQTFVSHSKLLSKLIMGISCKCSYAAYFWRMLRIHALKPEVFLLTILIIIFVVYLHKADKHSQSLLSGIKTTIRQSALKFQNAQLRDVTEEVSSNWECRSGNVAVFAVRGRRSHMEDRFVVTQNIRDTGVSLFAVFDGHGGEFAADYAKEHLVNNLTSRVIEIKNIIKGGSLQENGGESYIQRKSSLSLLENTVPHTLKRKSTIKRCSSQTDDTIKSDKNVGSVDADLIERLEKFLPISRDMHLSRNDAKNDNAAIRVEAHVYVDNGDRINYGRLLTDEVLAADRLLVEAAKKNMNIAGTTALIALVEGTRLIVANVGDSRGVMCDNKGNAIPLSFDHKPQQMREKKRIQDAGGFIAFNGVWRVAGILATSRALGDYPLKERKLVIADPDILTFDLINYKPQFILLASDGLWDTFTNEEAIAFVKDRLHEPHFGAKSITMQSFYKGSLDNITVLVINLSNHNWTENDTSHNSIH